MSLYSRWLALLATLVVSSAPALADEEAVRRTLIDYTTAFNAQQRDRVASFWSEGAVYTDRETGSRTEGRGAILDDITSAWQQRPALRMTGQVDHVRLINPDVAVATGETQVGLPSEPPSISAFSAILVRTGPAWAIESIEEMPAPRPPTSYDALRELEWLVGDWVDESKTARVTTTFRWTEGRSFLVRSYAMEASEGTSQRGTQVIGWDPQFRQIRSWTFASDGSFGSATWSRNGDAWLVRSSQTLFEGQSASGTFVLRRIDDDRMTLQLIGHEIDGEPQSTRPPVEVRRVASDRPVKKTSPSPQ